MKDKITVIFKATSKNIYVDIEIPTNITTRDLIIGLNNAFDLGIDTSDVKNCYLKVENPIMFMKGNKLLSDYNLREGSIIYYTE